MKLNTMRGAFNKELDNSNLIESFINYIDSKLQTRLYNTIYCDRNNIILRLCDICRINIKRTI